MQLIQSRLPKRRERENLVRKNLCQFLFIVTIDNIAYERNKKYTVIVHNNTH